MPSRCPRSGRKRGACRASSAARVSANTPLPSSCVVGDTLRTVRRGTVTDAATRPDGEENLEPTSDHSVDGDNVGRRTREVPPVEEEGAIFRVDSTAPSCPSGPTHGPGSTVRRDDVTGTDLRVGLTSRRNDVAGRDAREGLESRRGDPSRCGDPSRRSLGVDTFGSPRGTPTPSSLRAGSGMERGVTREPRDGMSGGCETVSARGPAATERIKGGLDPRDGTSPRDERSYGRPDESRFDAVGSRRSTRLVFCRRRVMGIAICSSEGGALNEGIPTRGAPRGRIERRGVDQTSPIQRLAAGRRERRAGAGSGGSVNALCIRAP